MNWARRIILTFSSLFILQNIFHYSTSIHFSWYMIVCVCLFICLCLFFSFTSFVFVFPQNIHFFPIAPFIIVWLDITHKLPALDDGRLLLFMSAIIYILWCFVFHLLQTYTSITYSYVKLMLLYTYTKSLSVYMLKRILFVHTFILNISPKANNKAVNMKLFNCF